MLRRMPAFGAGRGDGVHGSRRRRADAVAATRPSGRHRAPGRARPVLGVRVRARLVGFRGVARFRILDRLRDAPQLLEVRGRALGLVDDVEDEPVDLLAVLVGAAARREADALEQVLGLARAFEGSQELLLVDHARTYVQSTRDSADRHLICALSRTVGRHVLRRVEDVLGDTQNPGVHRRGVAGGQGLHEVLEAARDAIQFLVEGRLGLGLDSLAGERDAGTLGRRLRRLAREGAAVSRGALRG